VLNVKTPNEVLKIINNQFKPDDFSAESVTLDVACGRVLHHDVVSEEDVPGFNRSTVDGYAVIASDTFGCSESIPAILSVAGEILMGESAESALSQGTSMIVSTGGEVPSEANAVVMFEHTEDYGKGMIGIQKSVAPGNNIIFKGDDVSIGDIALTAGTRLTPHDIGILAALGIAIVDVREKPVVGIISTGDELIPPAEAPGRGQVRDVNTVMLHAAATSFGAEAKDFGLIKDDEKAIRRAVMSAVQTCDIVMISGGSSAGARDLTARVIAQEGELLLHGIAMKPGKPTILGKITGKPIFGLPGHPVAAYMVTELFIRPLIDMLVGTKPGQYSTKATLTESISSNHGREEYIAVRLEDGTAHPVRGKSGLIAGLAEVDGYICIPRDCEGLAKGAAVRVVYF
jgi:molybdopterin molybdotransferase